MRSGHGVLCEPAAAFPSIQHVIVNHTSLFVASDRQQLRLAVSIDEYYLEQERGDNLLQNEFKSRNIG